MRRSQLQERRLAASVGGHVQKASGATDFAKGDVVTPDGFYEAKTTMAKQYILRLSELEKNERDALGVRSRLPVMQVQFETQGRHKRYAVVNWEIFQELVEAARAAGWNF